MTTKPGNASYDANVMAFSMDTMATVLAAQGITSIPITAYAKMSELDGTRTVNSFQHQFRPVMRRAKELKAQMDGSIAPAVVTPKKRGAATKGDDEPEGTPTKKARATPKKKTAANGEKTPSKRRAKAVELEGNASHDDEETPARKEVSASTSIFGDGDFGVDFEDVHGDYIKQEPSLFTHDGIFGQGDEA